MMDWYRALLQLRRSTPSLWAGPLDSVVVRIDPDANAFTFQRGDIIVAAGLAPFRLPLPAEDAGWEMLLDSSGGASSLADNGHVQVPTEGCVVLRARSRPSS